MLLGYVAPPSDPEQLMIEHALGPGPGATHERHRFVPDGAWQQEQLADAYEASGRITTYLGDWHSHPAGTAVPSRRDHRTARSIARTASARNRRPLTVIVAPTTLGKADADWSAVAYRFDGKRLALVTLESL